MQYELAIIGGGPAGVAAGVYAARKKIKTVLITDSFGGQSAVSEDVRNWIGTKSIAGFDLAKNLEEHLRDQEGIVIKEGALAEKVERQEGGFAITLAPPAGGQADGEKLTARLLLITAGSRRRKLGVPGDDKFEGRGVVYCSTCDAPIFKNKTVAVVGGGNAGLEAVVDLISYATKIYLIVRSDLLKGDPITQEKVAKSDKAEIIYNAQTEEVLGDKFVTGLRYKNAKTGESKELKLDGVFVEIGSVPNSGQVKDFVQVNNFGEIIVDHKTQKAADGIWAAGDVTDVLYKQNNISMGDAVKAVLNIYEFIHKGDKAR